jgi:hypothetical protein
MIREIRGPKSALEIRVHPRLHALDESKKRSNKAIINRAIK